MFNSKNDKHGLKRRLQILMSCDLLNVYQTSETIVGVTQFLELGFPLEQAIVVYSISKVHFFIRHPIFYKSY